MNKKKIESIKEKYETTFRYMSEAVANQMFHKKKKNGFREPNDTIIDEAMFVYESIHSALDYLIEDDEVWTSCGGYDIKITPSDDEKTIYITISDQLVEEELEV